MVYITSCVYLTCCLTVVVDQVTHGRGLVTAAATIIAGDGAKLLDQAIDWLTVNESKGNRLLGQPLAIARRSINIKDYAGILAFFVFFGGRC